MIFLNESYNKTPNFFSYTHYKLPNKDELIDINKYNLSSTEILKGFIYTIVGKGIISKQNKENIIKSIKMLCDMCDTL